MPGLTVASSPSFTARRTVLPAPGQAAAATAPSHDPDRTHFSPAAARHDEPSSGGRTWLSHAGRAVLFTGLGVVGLAVASVGAVELAEAVVVTQQATVQMACEKNPSTFPLGVCPYGSPLLATWPSSR